MAKWTDLEQRSIALTWAACGLLSSATANAQAPVRALLQPTARLSRPFTRIAGVHELRDGRVVVLDANDQAVLLVNFTDSKAVQLGRKGSGPGEYLFPTGLLSLGGDSIGVEDDGNRRLLVIGREGKVSGLLSSLGTPGSRPASARGEAPSASDGQGHLYALAYSPFAPEASQPRDSAPIERWSVGSRVRDTVAYLPLGPVEDRILPPGETTRAFVTSPQWAVGLDGRIAIVRPDPYSVDLIDPKGARINGRPIRFRRLPVSEGHKRQWRADQSRPQSVMIMKPGDAAPTAGLRRRPIFEPVRWPDFLPPFLDHACRFAPDGFLWIQRTTMVDHPPLFDLVDRRGIVVEQVRLPPQTRLVGFGRSHVYLVRSDADDQEFLERYEAISRRNP